MGKNKRTNQKKLQFTLLGIGYGFLFPLIGTIFELLARELQFTSANILLIHQTDRLINIIDTAPFVIGITAFLIGVREDRLRSTGVFITKASVELQKSSEKLEQRVIDRTAELEKKTSQSERRTAQLEAVAGVALSIASLQDLDTLLPNITNQISKNFGYYHVSIFLLDEFKRFAIMQAASSEGGQKMLARNHRLQVGQQGIVGYVTSIGKALIASDVGEVSEYFDNTELPETQSEVALPLKLGNEIIGALDIQSIEKSAFTQADVSVFSILANQVAVAIQNSRSLLQAQRSLRDADLAAKQLTGQVWQDYSQSMKVIGFRYDGGKSQPLKELEFSPKEGSLHIPIQVRGFEVANLVLEAPDPDHQWTNEDISMAQNAAERAGLALENARLLEDAQRRAAKERTISEGAARVSADLDVESILQKTAEELENVLGSTELVIQFESEE